MELKDKICLITGATSGIGKVTAMELAKQGATVVLLARNKDRAEQTKQDIMNKTGNINIDIIIADLSSLKQTREAAATFNKNYSHLDILVNNAGFISTSSRRLTGEGFEETMAVNYLAPFLLTDLLFDRLNASPEARIVNVSSAAHRMAKVDFDDLQLNKNYSAIKAYGNAKLYLIMFTQALAKRLKDHPNITVNTLHPGFVASNFSKDAGGLMAWGFKILRPFQVTAEKGAETTVYLATAPEAINYSGLYFALKKPVKLTSKYLNDENEDLLWHKTEQLVGDSFQV